MNTEVTWELPIDEDMESITSRLNKETRLLPSFQEWLWWTDIKPESDINGL